jgi:Flp pilus assembly protein TadD
VFNPIANRFKNDLTLNNIMFNIKKDPGNPYLYSGLGQMYYDMEKWKHSKRAYELSLELKYNQPGVLNNLAWLLLTCPDKNIHDYPAALRLVSDAAKLTPDETVLDTLAEAYLANNMHREAVIAANKALQLARHNKKYFRQQLKRMKQAFLTGNSGINI